MFFQQYSQCTQNFKKENTKAFLLCSPFQTTSNMLLLAYQHLKGVCEKMEFSLNIYKKKLGTEIGIYSPDYQGKTCDFSS